MGLTINTNIFSLNAQRNLRKTEDPLQTTLQRLSSGFRINSARDDAAGFAIVTRQTTQIRGLSVAIRNANDGISFAQTAEGAMDEIINSLQRINELAIQAASNNTPADRISLNEEVQQLISELDRIVSQTRFNGDTFLNQAKSINIQVGTEVNETINISTASIAPTVLGVSTNYTESLSAQDVAVAAFNTFAAGSLASDATVAGQDIGEALTGITNNSLAVINRLNEFTGTTGVTAFNLGNAAVATSTLAVTSAGGTVATGFLTINGTAIGEFAAGTASSVANAALIDAINAKAATTGVTAYAADSTGVVATATAGNIVLSNTNGGSITVSQTTAVTNGSLVTTGPFATGTTSVAAGTNGKVILNASVGTTTVALNDGQTAQALGLNTANTNVNLAQSTVNSLKVTTAGFANVTMLATKNALNSVISEKAKLGAVQNRLLSTVANLDNVRENASQARSRIRDADFAEETSNLTKLLIIQQAGISVLSQANQLPQNVLALLQ